MIDQGDAKKLEVCSQEKERHSGTHKFTQASKQDRSVSLCITIQQSLPQQKFQQFSTARPHFAYHFAVLNARKAVGAHGRRKL